MADDRQARPKLTALDRAIMAGPALPEPLPPPCHYFPKVDADDFAGWLTPKDALSRVPYASDVAITQLRRLLTNDLVFAAAREATWPDGLTIGRTPLVQIPRWGWVYANLSRNSDFWETGFLEMNTSVGDDRVGDWINFFDIRFDPAGFLPEPPGAGEPSALKPPVGRASLESWHRVFIGVHPDAPEALALRSAAAMFPDNHVPRQWVRDLRGPQRLGKRPSRHE